MEAEKIRDREERRRQRKGKDMFCLVNKDLLIIYWFEIKLAV